MVIENLNSLVSDTFFSNLFFFFNAKRSVTPALSQYSYQSETRQKNLKQTVLLLPEGGYVCWYTHPDGLVLHARDLSHQALIVTGTVKHTMSPPLVTKAHFTITFSWNINNRNTVLESHGTFIDNKHEYFIIF